MKRILSILLVSMFVFASVTFTSCGGNNTNDTQTTDSTLISKDSVKVDSTIAPVVVPTTTTVTK